MHWSVCHLAGLLVGPVLPFQPLQRVASSFGLTAPAQSHATDAVVYTVLPTAGLLHLKVIERDSTFKPPGGCMGP